MFSSFSGTRESPRDYDQVASAVRFLNIFPLSQNIILIKKEKGKKTGTLQVIVIIIVYVSEHELFAEEQQTLGCAIIF